MVSVPKCPFTIPEAEKSLPGVARAGATIRDELITTAAVAPEMTVRRSFMGSLPVV
jgi:hypothetical protein